MFYSLENLNLELFYAVNRLNGGEVYNAMMLLATDVSSRDNFPIYLALFAIPLLSARLPIRLLWRKVLFVFAAAFLLDLMFVEWAKHYFHCPRPFVILPPETIHFIGAPMQRTEYYLSYPSGHASFAGLLAASTWPALNRIGKGCVLVFVFWTCWSRVAIGAHFPADVLAGAASAMALVALTRIVTQSFGIFNEPRNAKE